MYAGFRNRKFFVLFVLYSAAFCAMGAAHSWYELLALAPARGYVDDDAARPPHISRARVAIAWLHALLARADGANCGLYARAVLATCVINPAGALLLGGMGLNQLLLALQHGHSHRTRLAVAELGYCASSGHSWWLWAARHSQGEGRAARCPAIASSARVRRPQSRRFHRLWATQVLLNRTTLDAEQTRYDLGPRATARLRVPVFAAAHAAAHHSKDPSTYSLLPWARESPRRLDAEEWLQPCPGACPKLPIPPTLTITLIMQAPTGSRFSVGGRTSGCCRSTARGPMATV